MRGKYASCLRTANCCQRGLKELKSSGEWKRWLAYKFRDFASTGTPPGQGPNSRDCPGHSGTVGNYALQSGLYSVFRGLEGPTHDINPGNSNALDYLLLLWPASLCELIALDMHSKGI